MTESLQANTVAAFDNLVDLGMPCRQADFAQMVGVSQQAISNMVTAGILTHGGTAGVWLQAYCSRLREQAAGRASDGALDLVQERAHLAKEQRISQELKNAEKRKEVAPVALLSEVLARASQSVTDELNALPSMLKKVAPDMPDTAIDAIDEACRKARTNWVMGTASLDVVDVDELDEGDDEAV